MDLEAVVSGLLAREQRGAKPKKDWRESIKSRLFDSRLISFIFLVNNDDERRRQERRRDK
jgi:hypothetical protein